MLQPDSSVIMGLPARSYSLADTGKVKGFGQPRCFLAAELAVGLVDSTGI